MSVAVGTGTDRCPFAVNPDMTGCDCDCALVRPKGNGFWSKLRRLFTPMMCITGPGGSGTGRLPCPRFSEWKRHSRGEVGNG